MSAALATGEVKRAANPRLGPLKDPDTVRGVDEPLPRPLAPEEHDALRAFLQQADPRYRDRLLAQAEAATVVGGCDCGCATIDLEVPGTLEPVTRVPNPLPGYADVRDDDGNELGGLIVFLSEHGYLSRVEIYAYEDAIEHFPPVQRLHFR